MEWVTGTFGSVIAFLSSHLFESIALFLLMVVEFWLGRSNLVKPGSTLEAILLSIKKVLELIGKAKDAVVGKK
jgi:uncharacterized membrane protein